MALPRDAAPVRERAGSEPAREQPFLIPGSCTSACRQAQKADIPKPTCTCLAQVVRTRCTDPKGWHASSKTHHSCGCLTSVLPLLSLVFLLEVNSGSNEVVPRLRKASLSLELKAQKGMLGHKTPAVINGSLFRGGLPVGPSVLVWRTEVGPTLLRYAFLSPKVVPRNTTNVCTRPSSGTISQSFFASIIFGFERGLKIDHACTTCSAS